MESLHRPKALHTANLPTPLPAFPSNEQPAPPFITIAQQIGAECFPLPGQLTNILNERDRTGARWSHWDQELVEKVSADHHIPADLIVKLDTTGHSWLDDFLNGLSGRVDEMVVFNRVRESIRRLARTGHVILIGHGSTYMTRDLPGGLHVRLIAPLDFRTRNVASRFGLRPEEAVGHMRRMDKMRQRFFSQFWPDLPLDPELFAAVMNVAELDDQRLTNSIAAMVPVAAT